MDAIAADARRARLSASRATLSACSAVLVGVGLARFAYTPLLPALVTDRWLSASEAAYLGAANLAGYLVGAVAARGLARGWGAALLLRAMMALASLAFLACAAPLSFGWFALWRSAAGVAGGVLMVLAGPSVLPAVPPAKRGFAGGVIFMGVGLGIAASGTVVPLLMRWGLSAAWCGLALLSALLTLGAWRSWPTAGATPAARSSPAASAPARALRSLYVEYALNAAGLVPHMIFLVDFVARGAGQGLAAGARYWVLLGCGAIAGPVVFGRIADRVGFARAVRLAYAVEAVCIGALAVTAVPPVLAASSLSIGALIPGTTSLVLGRVRELTGNDPAAQTAAWGIATLAFALGQTAAAYGCSYLFDATGDYALLFGLGGATLVLALALNLAVVACPGTSPHSTAELG